MKSILELLLKIKEVKIVQNSRDFSRPSVNNSFSNDNSLNNSQNIVLNDKKADGTEILKAGDNVKLYLSDDTIAKFSKNSTDSENSAGSLKSITDKSKYYSSKIDKVKPNKNKLCF